MRLPRGVRSGLSDALERFEEDEWSGSSDSVKRIAYVRHFANDATCIQLSVLSVQSPGEPGFFWVFIPGLAFFLKPPFLFVPAGEMYAHPVAFL